MLKFFVFFSVLLDDFSKYFKLVLIEDIIGLCVFFKLLLLVDNGVLFIYFFFVNFIRFFSGNVVFSKVFFFEIN